MAQTLPDPSPSEGVESGDEVNCSNDHSTVRPLSPSNYEMLKMVHVSLLRWTKIHQSLSQKKDSKVIHLTRLKGKAMAPPVLRQRPLRNIKPKNEKENLFWTTTRALSVLINHNLKSLKHTEGNKRLDSKAKEVREMKEALIAEGIKRQLPRNTAKVARLFPLTYKPQHTIFIIVAKMKWSSYPDLLQLIKVYSPSFQFIIFDRENELLWTSVMSEIAHKLNHLA